MTEPGWLTQPIVAVHEIDTYVLSEHPAESTGRGKRLHAHTIQEDRPHDHKQLLADHLDRHHGGIKL